MRIDYCCNLTAIGVANRYVNYKVVDLSITRSDIRKHHIGSPIVGSPLSLIGSITTWIYMNFSPAIKRAPVDGIIARPRRLAHIWGISLLCVEMNLSTVQV
jgi:hypothetical protein